MKRDQTIESLVQLAEQTAQVQADRIEIVLEERSDEIFPNVKSPYGDPLWTDSQKVRRGY